MIIDDFDVAIIGAGPAGCVCALQLAKTNLKIALIEKETFPRDKICGDALSADVINQLTKLDAELLSKFEAEHFKKASNGVRFFSPNGKSIDIDFNSEKTTSSKPVRRGGNGKTAAGYIVKRIDFDNFLFEEVKNCNNISIIENTKIIDVSVEAEFVLLKTRDSNFKAKFVVGADGANSIINRKLTNNKLDKNHHCAGLRQYFENVTGFHEQNHIELHFYKELLPGYFWIFPLPNNQANVGLGMLSSEVSKQNLNLKEKLNEIITTHPNIKDRFANAKPLETIQGFGLPIGSKKKQLSGNRFLLLGDAANLIDPFTGEGIGNAIRSGRIAAEHINLVFIKNDFSAKFNKKYDAEIYQKMWNELRLGRSLQNMLKYPKLFNFVVKKANKNESLRTLLTSMLTNVDLKKELVKPSFYFKLIFN